MSEQDFAPFSDESLVLAREFVPDPWDQCLDVDPFTGQPDHGHGDACENPDCS